MNEAREREYRKSLRRIRGELALRAASILLTGFFLWAIVSAGYLVLTVLSVTVGGFVILWLGAGFVGLMAQYEQTVAGLKVEQYFPAMTDLSEEERLARARKLDLDRYKL